MKKYALVVDIGKTYIRVAVGDKDGNFLYKNKVETAKTGNKDTIAKQVLGLIKRINDLPKIEAIGIGCFGQLNFKNGKIVINTNDCVFKSADLSLISKKTKIPTYVLNDTNASALGEKYYGLGKEKDNFVYLTISTGIGAGAFIDNKLLFGENGNAPEPYRIIMNDFGNWQDCSAGLSMPKFFKYKTKSKENLETREIFERAKKGDKQILEFLDEVGRINAIGFATLINFFDPELIIVGGAVALNNQKIIIGGIKKYLKDYTDYKPEIKLTKLGDDVGLYGALASAFNKIGYKI